MPESQEQGKYQGFTIKFCRKTILRKRIPGNRDWQFITFENSSPPTIKTIKKGISNLSFC